MSRERIPIPRRVESSLLLANRHACCVCQKAQVQIHHIDEDPSNNDLANLAVLCLEHHDHATMKTGLSKKLRPDAVRHYKQEWEARCAADVQALSRGRAAFYSGLYKNPPRIRELLQALQPAHRARAVDQLRREIAEDIEHHNENGNFFNRAPGDNSWTEPFLESLRAGELWPSGLPRVQGHARDPDYPNDFAPPYGMVSFHGFDWYCQMAVRAFCIVSPPVALEYLWDLESPELINQFAGSLVSFQERAYGKGITIPSQADQNPLGRIQFRVKREGRVCRAVLPVKNMYVFSDTASFNLQSSRVSGIALLEDAQEVMVKGVSELHVGLKPLVIGMGSLGRGW